MDMKQYNGIWVFAEQENAKMNPVTWELLAKARALGAECGESVTAVLLGEGVAQLSTELFARGADEVIIAEHTALAKYSARPYQQALTQLARKYNPSIILYGATPLGRDLAPRMMVSLNTGLTADAIDLSFDDDGVFCQTTPAYGGKLLAHIAIPESRTQMVTVRPNTFEPFGPDYSRRGSALIECVEIAEDNGFEVLETRPKHSSGVQLDRAKVIVAGGRGVKTERDLELLHSLADTLGGQIACSRPLAESGLLSHDYQLGQSGATVKPELIINAAISGAIQYRVGMQGAKRIASINLNPSAAIFSISQYGMAADFRSLIPAITEEIARRRQN